MTNIEFHLQFFLVFVQILFDFEIRSSDTNANALIEQWPTLKLNIPLELQLAEINECMGYFDEEVGSFIALLKLLSNKPNFAEKVRSFLMFTDVSKLNDIK